MEEMMEQIDAMEEEQRLNTLQQIMAALPKTKKATRKSTRAGAGKRKVHFGEVDRSRWQQPTMSCRGRLCAYITNIARYRRIPPERTNVTIGDSTSTTSDCM